MDQPCQHFLWYPFHCISTVNCKQSLRKCAAITQANEWSLVHLLIVVENMIQPLIDSAIAPPTKPYVLMR